MAIKIFGAFRSDTNLGDSAVTYATSGTTFQISSYSSLTMTDGADGTIIDGDNVSNEAPNDLTQTFAGNAIAWDYTIQVTDGTNNYEIGVIDYDLDGDGSFDYPTAEQGYFLAFVGGIPPLNTDLTIGSVTDNGPSLDVDTVVPCYAPGTLIGTPDGPRAVETLCPGDRLLTLDNGPQDILWSHHDDQPLEHVERDAKPVLIAAGALGNGLPQRDLIVSPQHRILVGEHGQLAHRFDRAAFAPAKSLTSLRGIRSMMGKRHITWVHFACARHEVVFANGCLSESLLLGPMVVNGLTATQRQALTDIYGRAPGPDTAWNGPPARECLSVGAVRRGLKKSRAKDDRRRAKEIRKWELDLAMEHSEAECLRGASSTDHRNDRVA